MNSDCYILGIDQGTSGTTLLLVNARGELVFKHQRALPQSFPQPGWVEEDPELIWQSVREGIAFQVKEVIHTMMRVTKSSPEVLRVDGGAAANDSLLQFQADLCGLPIQRNS